MINKDEIIKFCKTHNRPLYNKTIIERFPEFYKEVCIAIPDDISISEKIWIYFNGRQDLTCSICKTDPIEFKGYKYGYSMFCSAKCSHVYNTGRPSPRTVPNELIQEKRKKYCMEVYGVDIASKSDAVKAKISTAKLANPRKKKEFPDDIKAEMIKLYNEDKSIRAITLKMDIDGHIIADFLTSQGIVIDRGQQISKSKRIKNADKHKKILELTNTDTMTISDISKQVDLSYGTVQKWMIEQNADFKKLNILDRLRNTEVQLNMAAGTLNEFRFDYDKFDKVRDCLKGSRVWNENTYEKLKHFYYDEGFNFIYNRWLNDKCLELQPSLDHMVPNSRGGTDSINNLITMTFTENWTKSDMPFDEWIKFKKLTNTIGDIFVDSDRIGEGVLTESNHPGFWNHAPYTRKVSFSRIEYLYKLEKGWLSKFDNKLKISFLSGWINTYHVNFGPKYVKTFFEKFYHDEAFNSIYDNWIGKWNYHPFAMPTIDHDVPLALGGSDRAVENFSVMSYMENRMKRCLSRSEWKIFKEKYSIKSDLFV